MVNIFIANLDWSITSEDLNTTFSSFGAVHYAHVVYEKESRKSRGYGYVEMESAESAIAAIEALNGMEINGRAIDVKIASPKSNRPKKEENPAPVAKKPFNNRGGGRPQNGGDRRPYSNNGGGDRRPYNNNGGERRPYNNNGGGERRPYNNNDGERRSYNNNNDGERRPYNNNDGERRPYNNNNGERRTYNNDRPYTPRDNSERPARQEEDAPRFSPRVEPDNTANNNEGGEVKRVLRPRRPKQ